MKKLTKIFGMFLILLILLSSFPVTFAGQDFDTIGNLYIPRAYILTEVIKDLGEAVSFNNPSHLFIKNDIIYIADTDNNRIVKMTLTGETLSIFEHPNLSGPQGIFVADDGDLYIANTKGESVMHVSSDGRYVEEFTKPDSRLYDDNYPFKPVKVAIDNVGTLYIINNDDYHGFLMIDAFNTFKGYFGADKVPARIEDFFMKWFGTKEQRAKMRKDIPPVHTNMVIPDGTIYVVTGGAEETKLKRLVANGVNIFPRKYFYDNYIDPLTYMAPGSSGAFFSSRDRSSGNYVDVAVDDLGIVLVLDQNSGRISQYDANGDLLCSFAGQGNWAGKFMNAVSLDLDSNGNAYVLDSMSGLIHKFEPTSFIKTVHEALALYYEGEYEKSVEPWKEVLLLSSNYYVAHQGMARAYAKQEQWDLVMESYKLAENPGGYSQGFREQRLILFRENFEWIMIGVVVIAILLVRLLMYLFRLERRIY